MNTGHEEFSEWAGAYAFGALEPDDRRAFERHLAQCSICAHDVKAFAPIPGLLAQVDRAELDDPTDANTARAIATRVRLEERQVRKSRARWRAAAISAAAGLLILGGLLAVTPLIDPNEGVSPPTAAAVVVSSQAESAAVFTSERGWGTEIHLDLAGLPPRQQYQLWAVDENGTWSAAATWGPTPNGGAKVTGATSLATETLARVVVTAQDRDDVLIDTTT
ncbi:MAG: zf-HC2 domain-containing protein [Acidimicrobiales bacterium]